VQEERNPHSLLEQGGSQALRDLHPCCDVLRCDIHTDADCISEYRSHLGTDRVHLLPFAAQPNMHNPIETLERKDSFYFAGSYCTQQMDRNIMFSRFVTAISLIGELEIFDRYLNT
jgi:hypothetical protein